MLNRRPDATERLVASPTVKGKGKKPVEEQAWRSRPSRNG